MRIMLSFMLVSTYVPASMLLLDLMCCFVASGFAVGVLLACAAVGLLLLLVCCCCCCLPTFRPPPFSEVGHHRPRAEPSQLEEG